MVRFLPHSWLFVFLIFFGGIGTRHGGDAVVVVSSSFASSSSTTRDGWLLGAKLNLRRFLNESSAAQHGGRFHVLGWKWHTMSLEREAERLHKLARHLLNEERKDEEVLPALAQAVDYVVGFNMKGLHKIERNLFFPWIRKRVMTELSPTEKVAIGKVLEKLERDQKDMEQLGDRLSKELADQIKNASSQRNKQHQLIESIANQSARIAQHVRSMSELENSLLVPTIAQTVSEKDQKSFNSAVVRNIGILDSRLHLVHMHEAVWALNDQKERQLFEETVPAIPRMLIPRWKRLLYEPQAGILDAVV